MIKRNYHHFIVIVLLILNFSCFKKSSKTKNNNDLLPPPSEPPTPPAETTSCDEFANFFKWHCISTENQDEVTKDLILKQRFSESTESGSIPVDIIWTIKSVTSDIADEDYFSLVFDNSETTNITGKILQRPLYHSSVEIVLEALVTRESNPEYYEIPFKILPLSKNESIFKLAIEQTPFDAFEANQINSQISLPSIINIQLPGEDEIPVSIIWQIEETQNEPTGNYFTISDYIGNVTPPPYGENQVSLSLKADFLWRSSEVYSWMYHIVIPPITSDQEFSRMISLANWHKISTENQNSVSLNLNDKEGLNDIGFDQISWIAYPEKDTEVRPIGHFFTLNSTATGPIGTIIRPATGSLPYSVKLIASFTWNQKNDEKIFNFDIKPITESETIAELTEPVLWDIIKGQNESMENIKTNLSLPQTISGLSITWSSNKPHLILPSGVVSLRSRWPEEKDGSVRLEAILDASLHQIVLNLNVGFEPVLNPHHHLFYKGFFCHDGIRYDDVYLRIEKVTVTNIDSHFRKEATIDKARFNFDGEIKKPNPDDSSEICTYSVSTWINMEGYYIFGNDLNSMKMILEPVEDPIDVNVLSTEPGRPSSCYDHRPRTLPTFKELDGTISGSTHDTLVYRDSAFILGSDEDAISQHNIPWDCRFVQ